MEKARLLAFEIRALRRLYSVGGDPKILAAAARRGRLSSVISHICLKRFSVKNLCYKGMHVQQLFLLLSAMASN